MNYTKIVLPSDNCSPRRIRLNIFRNCLLLLLSAATVSLAQAQSDVIWQQDTDFQADWGPSQRNQTAAYDLNSEVADDFDLIGTVNGIDIAGYNNALQLNPEFGGVYVRFYASNSVGAPGALQAEYFVPAGDPRLVYAAELPSDLQINLSPAFQASGKHFVAVQVLMDPAFDAYWYPRSANTNAARGQTLYFRDPVRGHAAWSHDFFDLDGGFFSTANSDMGFTLYGTRTLGVSSISSLSTSSLAKAGRLRINGSGFGPQQGSSVVKIGGVTAPVSNWSDSVITAYVPDAAPLGLSNVEVQTSGGTSNTETLTVVSRPKGTGHIKWRFMADDLYIVSRPAVGPDGTIYAAGVNGHLYALAPNGGVKWIFNAGPGNVLQPVSVAGDGTIYFSSEADIYAVSPLGKLKWKFTEPAFRRIFAGPTAGPDGNIYAVSQDFGQGGLGEFQLSPAGQLLGNDPGYGTRSGFSGIEVVFDSLSQFYFTANAGRGGLSAYQLGGAAQWRQKGTTQPRVAPDGSIINGDGLRGIHPGISAHNADGSVKWHVLGGSTGIDARTPVDVGIDGASYLGTLTSGVGRHITRLRGDGAIDWQYREVGTASSPAISPDNTLLIAGTTPQGAPSKISALDPSTGTLLWSETLPPENGGSVREMSMPRFAPNNAAVYIGMDVNDYAADAYSYLYAFSRADLGTP